MIKRTKEKNTSKNLKEERRDTIDGFKFPKYSKFLYVVSDGDKLSSRVRGKFICFFYRDAKIRQLLGNFLLMLILILNFK